MTIPISTHETQPLLGTQVSGNCIAERVVSCYQPFERYVNLPYGQTCLSLSFVKAFHDAGPGAVASALVLPAVIFGGLGILKNRERWKEVAGLTVACFAILLLTDTFLPPPISYVVGGITSLVSGIGGSILLDKWAQGHRCNCSLPLRQEENAESFVSTL